MNEAQPPSEPVTGSEAPTRQDAAKQARDWGMIIHFSVLASVVIPLLGVVAPIIVWQLKKDEIPSIVPHANVVFNWLVSSTIYLFVSLLLCLVVIGIPLLFALSVVAVVFPIVGGIKAGNGEVWPYPLSIKVFR